MGSGDIDQEFMYRAIDASMHAVIFCDLDLNIEWVNREFLLKFNLENVGEAKGKSIRSLLRDPESITTPMIELLKTGRWQGELQFQRSDGSVIDTLVTATILPDASGNPLKIIASGMDITEEKQAEEALQKSRQSYCNLLESTTDWVWAIDLEGVHTFSNEAVKKLLDYEVNEVVGESVFPMMHPDDQEAMQAMVEESVEQKKGWRNVGIRWLHKDGSVHLFESTSQPLYDAEGDLVGFTGIDRDITERKQSEETLRKSEERFRHVADNAQEWIWEVDCQGLYTYSSPVVEKILGYKPEEIVGQKHFYDFFYPDDREELKKVALQAFAEKQTFSEFINRNLHKNGEVVWLSTSGTPILDENGNLLGYRGADTDITERKRLEEQVRHRLIALTQPEVDLGDLSLTDIVGVDVLQRLQDAFADAFNMPSIIYGPDGVAITKPSRFTSFCTLVRSTEEGATRCEAFDSELMHDLRENHAPQIRRSCALSNIVTGTVPIITQGQHLANWGIGQMVNRELDLEEVRQYAREIGLDEKELVAAARTLIPVDDETFERAVAFLSILSEQVSLLALQNLQQGRDIAARKRAEEALYSERRLFVSGPTIIFRWVAAEGWPVEYVSPNVESVFGLTAEDFMSGKVLFASVVHPDDLQRVAKEVDQYTRNKTDSFEQEYRIVRPDGEIRWLFDITVITRDEEGAASHYEGYVLDVTDRRQADVERERLMSAIEQAAETVMITDAEGTIQYVNPAFERITGYTRNEAIGQNPRILQSGKHDNVFYRQMWETLERGETWTGRFINRKKDETLYTEEATISPVRDSSGETVNYVAVKRDITEEIRIDDQLRQAQRMEAVGQLAGGVAHDFNNLLQAISGYTELALSDLDSSHPAHSSIEEVARAGNRARTLVCQLLSFSRRQIINPVDIDLNEVIGNLMNMIRRVIAEDIELDFIPGHGLGIVHADRGQMEQVLMNLCVNSRDSMPDGGTITIETGNVLINGEYIKTHPWGRAGRYVLFSVTDTGCGMDEKTLSSAFDPFFTTKEVGKGTGLGLSTVYGIVKQHDGQIQAYSEVGKGTMFKIYLPAVERSAAEVSSSVRGPTVGGTETILVAEDDETVRKLSIQTLERAGYTVLDAADGEEAMRLFKAHADEIALVVLDVVMPGLSGRQVHDRIKKSHPGIRVLFSSGYSHNAIHTRFVLDEGLQLIQKPYSPDTLVRRVREVLDA